MAGSVTWLTSPRQLGFTIGTGPSGLFAPSDDLIGASALAQGGLLVDQAAVDAAIKIGDDGRVDRVRARDGVTLDVDRARKAIRDGIAANARRIELPTRPTVPRIADDLVEAAFAHASRLLAGDGPYLSARHGDRFWTFNRRDFAALLAIEPAKPGTPARVTVDAAVATRFLQSVAPVLARAPRNARVAVENGRAKLLDDGQPGQSLDVPGSLAVLRRAIASDARQVALAVNQIAPAIGGGADLAKLDVSELIEKGSTALGGAIPEKRHNIKIATERLHGAIIMPGETFSFNNTVGPTTLEAGFKWGYGITTVGEEIKTIPSVAGGICQVATTLFQPVFWAGYRLEERYWHLYWIPSYASRGIVGLDVTVDEEAGLDLKWVNVSSTPVVIQAAFNDQSVSFMLYGRKPGWKVEVAKPVVTNVVPPDRTPVYEEDPRNAWPKRLLIEEARDGFDVEVTRMVTTEGAEPRVLKMKSAYQPSRSVTLIGIQGKPPGAKLEDALPPGTPTPAIKITAQPNRPATPRSGATTPEATVVAGTPRTIVTATPRPATAGTPLPTSRPTSPTATVAAIGTITPTPRRASP
ncbi:MAG: hypothetical protein EPO26_17390 [Chloroflexota bacterium]|nr:MAG: hypothetical protein EPO26_17390 [Chloroflexota bacterium]